MGPGQMRPSSYLLLLIFFIIAAPLRQLLMCISSEVLSEMITVKVQQIVAFASEKMFN